MNQDSNNRSRRRRSFFGPRPRPKAENTHVHDENINKEDSLKTNKNDISRDDVHFNPNFANTNLGHGNSRRRFSKDMAQFDLQNDHRSGYRNKFKLGLNIDDQLYNDQIHESKGKLRFNKGL